MNADVALLERPVTTSRKNKLSPLNRVRIGVLIVPTAFATIVVSGMMLLFKVGFSSAHAWLFGIVWLISAAGYIKGAVQHEALRYMGQETGSDVFRYIETRRQKMKVGIPPALVIQKFGAATAWGVLERQSGKYLQTTGNSHGA